MTTEKTPPQTSIVQLKELGAHLPLGILDSGSYVRDIALRPWRMAEERELGRIRDANKDANIATFVSLVLSVMCTRLGPHDFGNMKPEQRRVIIGQMFMGDVLYVYVWLRVQTMGNMLDLNLTCASCGHKFPFKADLETVEVETAETEDAASWTYKLRDPFKIRDRMADAIRMGPTRWNALEMMDGRGGMNTGAAKAGIIQGCFRGLADDDKPMVIGDSELDDMSKWDLEHLTTEIDDYSIGPNMAVEGKCPRCNRDFRTSMDWGYDSFFGVSSR